MFLLMTFYFGNAVSRGLDVTAVDCLLSFDDILFEWQCVRVCCGCLKARGMAVSELLILYDFNTDAVGRLYASAA